MAIIRNVNMDLNVVDPKFVGNFTVRQTIAVTIGGGVSIAIWALLPGNVLIDVKIVLLMLINSPLIAFGWLNYNGLKIEDLIKTSLITIVLSPPVRKYKTDNSYKDQFYDIKGPEKQKNKKSKTRKKKIKNNKEQPVEVIQSMPSQKITKQKKVKSKKAKKVKPKRVIVKKEKVVEKKPVKTVKRGTSKKNLNSRWRWR